MSAGRILAGLIVEPGSTPFHLVSGALDGFTQVALDPTYVAGKGAKTAIVGARTVGLSDKGGAVVQGLDEAKGLAGKADELETGINTLRVDPDVIRHRAWTPAYRRQSDRLADDWITEDMVASGDATRR